MYDKKNENNAIEERLGSLLGEASIADNDEALLGDNTNDIMEE